MLKKIIITFFVISISIVGVFAEVKPHTYDNKILTKDGKTVYAKPIQEGIKSKLSATQYKEIGEHFLEKDGSTMSPERVKELLSDGDYGEVTKFAEGLANGENSEKSHNDTAEAKKKVEPTSGNCKYDPDEGGDIGEALAGCIGESKLVQPGELSVTGGFKDVLIGWIQKVAGFLALGAIFAIAFGSLRLTLSMGEDDQIKKAKDIIKWGILGFIAVISAGFLIALVVNLMYSIG